MSQGITVTCFACITYRLLVQAVQLRRPPQSLEVPWQLYFETSCLPWSPVLFPWSVSGMVTFLLTTRSLTGIFLFLEGFQPPPHLSCHSILLSFSSTPLAFFLSFPFPLILSHFPHPLGISFFLYFSAPPRLKWSSSYMPCLLTKQILFTLQYYLHPHTNSSCHQKICEK